MTSHPQWREQALAAKIRGMKLVKRAMIAAFGLHVFTPLFVIISLTFIFLFHAR